MPKEPNVLIPMAGRGARFSNVGYDLPKPLIEIQGKPIIEYVIQSLGIVSKNYIFVVQEEHIKHFQIDKILKRIIPSCKIVTTDTVTDGPACSALLAQDYIDNDRELVIANCDQIMTWNANAFLHNSRLYDGCVVTYHHDSPKNSYVKLNDRGYAVEFAEKKIISNISLNGIHYWRKGIYFVDSANEMISNNDRCNNEFYISLSYNYLIQDGKWIGIHHIPNSQHHNVGVPEDFATYVGSLNIDS